VKPSLCSGCVRSYDIQESLIRVKVTQFRKIRGAQGPQTLVPSIAATLRASSAFTLIQAGLRSYHATTLGASRWTRGRNFNLSDSLPKAVASVISRVFWPPSEYGDGTTKETGSAGTVLDAGRGAATGREPSVLPAAEPDSGREGAVPLLTSGLRLGLIHPTEPSTVRSCEKLSAQNTVS
jgi:hypothetical protein